MSTIRIFGCSDAPIEVEGVNCFERDEFSPEMDNARSCSGSSHVDWQVTMLKFKLTSRPDLWQSRWRIGLSQVDDDERIPDWPMTVVRLLDRVQHAA